MYQVSSKISTKILSVLRMKLILLEERRRLTCRGKHTGVVGFLVPPFLGVDPYTYRMPRSNNASGSSPVLGTSIAAKVKLELRDGQ